MKTKNKNTAPLVSSLMLLFLLAACGSSTQFSAPEIEPPQDLMSGYLPDGYELISGFELDPQEPFLRELIDDGDQRMVWQIDLVDPFFLVKSPLGNKIEGIHYQHGDTLLLITKSYFPEGSLESWEETFLSGSTPAEECECAGHPRLMGPFFNRRAAEIVETRQVGGVEVVVLQSPSGWITVFVRGDYLLSVEGGLSLEENLKVVEGLLNL